MGMFDTVVIRCPHCDSKVKMQSKMGPCILMEYTLNDAPLEVLADVAVNSQHTECHCGAVVSVDVETYSSVTTHGKERTYTTND